MVVCRTLSAKPVLLLVISVQGEGAVLVLLLTDPIRHSHVI